MQKPEKRSEATPIPQLLKKHKKLLKTYYHFIPFKEPVLFLIRRNGTVEFKENATTGRYEFKHSNKEDRYLIIEGNQLNFEIGDKYFKGYICHEDIPFPLPQKPLLLTEDFNRIIDKTLHDKKEWETKLTKARTKMIWSIIGGICAIIGMLILYKILVPQPPTNIPVQLAQQIKSNATTIINQSGVTVLG